MGEPYVKRFVEERELTVLLLVDVSPSQDFGSARRSKREAAAELSAMLAFSAIHNDDKVGLMLFHGAVDEYIPPRKGQKHALLVIREVLARGRVDATRANGDGRRGGLLRLPRTIAEKLRRLVTLTRTQPARATNIAHALEFCRRVLPRRSVLFLISDFIDDDYLAVLRSANRRHDVVCALIADERELDLDDAGLITLQDAETGQQRLVDTSSAAFRDSARAAATARVAKLETELRASGIDLLHIDATKPVIEPLLGFFRARQRRLRR
jgi:uncharacterized protein (DUF58 family)